VAVEEAAVEGVLVAPGLVEEARLKKPVKFMSVRFHQCDVWFGLKRFCQLLLEASYFCCSAVLVILTAI
jgi:hypothetical protein